MEKLSNKIKKRGRPKGSGDPSKKSTTYGVRLYEKELDEAKRAALKLGVPLNTLLRTAIATGLRSTKGND